MKIKQWVALLLPLVKEVVKHNEIENPTEEQKVQGKDAFDKMVQAYDKLVDECGEAYKQNMELVEKRAKTIRHSFGRREDSFNKDFAKALMDASVKLRGTNQVIKYELGIEQLPFPLSDASLITSTVSKFYEEYTEKKISQEEAELTYQTLDDILRKAFLRDDPLVGALMDILKNQIVQAKVSRHMSNLAAFAEGIDAYIAQNGHDLSKIIAEIQSNPKLRALANKIRANV